MRTDEIALRVIAVLNEHDGDPRLVRHAEEKVGPGQDLVGPIPEESDVLLLARED